MTDRKPISNNEVGFTLLEMLIVIGIIALLAALTTPQLLKYLGRAKADTAQTQLIYLANALDFYYLDVGSFPTTSEGLESLLEKPASAATWDGPYLKNKVGLIDPWGTPYAYEYSGTALPKISSLGADGIAGGEGDSKDLAATPSEF